MSLSVCNMDLLTELCEKIKNEAEKPKHPEWPSNRPPVPNAEMYSAKMGRFDPDRAALRGEIFDDHDNPLDMWWTAYYPSQEYKEAIEAKFDFENAEKWCKERGVDYDKAIDETYRLWEERYNAWNEKKQKIMAMMTPDNLQTFETTIEYLQKFVVEYKLRAEDAKRMEEKEKKWKALQEAKKLEESMA